MPSGDFGCDTVNGTNQLSRTLARDQSGHLTSAASTGGTLGWTYDGNDNLTASGTSGITCTYSYAAAAATGNELLSVTASGTAPASSYGYDDNGNAIMGMTRPTDSGVLQSGNVLACDAQGRLVSTTMLNGTVVAQSYNAARLRDSYSVTGVGQSVPGLSE